MAGYSLQTFAVYFVEVQYCQYCRPVAKEVDCGVWWFKPVSIRNLDHLLFGPFRCSNWVQYTASCICSTHTAHNTQQAHTHVVRFCTSVQYGFRLGFADSMWCLIANDQRSYSIPYCFSQAWKSFDIAIKGSWNNYKPRSVSHRQPSVLKMIFSETFDWLINPDCL